MPSEVSRARILETCDARGTVSRPVPQPSSSTEVADSEGRRGEVTRVSRQRAEERTTSGLESQVRASSLKRELPDE